MSSETQPAMDTPVKEGGFRPLLNPVLFVLLAGAIAFGARYGLPGANPFDIYFQQYLQTGGQGRGQNIPARIAQLGKRGGERVMALLSREDLTPEQRLAAVRLAGYSGDKRLEQDLLKNAAPGNDTEIRTAALESLSRLGGNLSVELCKASLQDPEPGVRKGALQTLGEGTPAALLPLVEKIAINGDTDERTEAARALGRVGTPQARKTLWKRYNESAEISDILAASEALQQISPPDAQEAMALAAVASGYLPVAYSFPSRRAQDRLLRRLHTLLTYRIEEILEEDEEPGHDCSADQACRNRHLYYRDLIRRKTQINMATQAFVALPGKNGNGRTDEMLLFVRTEWLLRDTVRHILLSMVRMIGRDPAIFPVQEMGYDALSGETRGATPVPAVGRVLRVTGDLKRHDLEVELVTPQAGIPTVERYLFQGGVFTQTGSQAGF